MLVSTLSGTGPPQPLGAGPPRLADATPGACRMSAQVALIPPSGGERVEWWQALGAALSDDVASQRQMMVSAGCDAADVDSIIRATYHLFVGERVAEAVETGLLDVAVHGVEAVRTAGLAAAWLASRRHQGRPDADVVAELAKRNAECSC